MPQIFGITRTALPSRQTDGTQQQVRVNAYGEQIVVPIAGGFYPIACEGSYFKAINPTFNTAAAWNVAAATAFSETQGSITIRNSNSSGGKDIYLDYIRITCNAAGTGNTNLSFVIQIDNAIRYSSGGAAATIVNCNSGTANSTGAVIHFGALTLAAASASRKLNPGAMIIKAAAPAANDVYLFNFGAVDTVANAPGTTVAIPCGPVLLPAGANHTFILHLISAGQSVAPTGFVEIGYIER